MAVPANIGTVYHDSGKSGGGPPQSKTLARFGGDQISRSVVECANVNLNCYIQFQTRTGTPRALGGIDIAITL